MHLSLFFVDFTSFLLITLSIIIYLAIKGLGPVPLSESFHFFVCEFYFIYFLYNKFLLVIYFIHITVHMSNPISQFIPPPPPPHHFPPLVSMHLFSTSGSLFLPCEPVRLYHFSKFHMYPLIYDICFSLSDLLHSA